MLLPRAKAHINWNTAKLKFVLQKDMRYAAYLHHVAAEIRDAAILVFVKSQIATNEAETSEYTPPKYLASFRIRVYHEALKAQMANVDPGWVLVEWGAHPGGDQGTTVLRYKPLTRGLLIVGRRFV